MTDIADTSYSIGSAVRERRRLLGLTQAEVAGLGEVSRDTVVRVEADDGGIALATLRRIAAAVGLEITLQPRYRDS
jgi:transcriptional regulator with XRE-family HTH domain